MSPLPDRNALEAMKRVDIQKLCKDYGVKANLKTEALIDLLLGVNAPTRSTPTQPTHRSVSTRKSSRSGAGRNSSVIIHDSEDENKDEDEEERQEDSDQPETENLPEPEPVLPPPPRTRKAKETQTRLGVGRPVAAGGAGPRAVTKSLSVSRSRRGKISKSIKSMEATIPEEESEPELEALPDASRDPKPSTPSPTQEPELPKNSTLADDSPLTSLADIDKYVTDALRPLHEQVRSLKSELEQMHTLKVELDRLKAQMTQMDVWQQKIQDLTIEVEGLRAQAENATRLGTELEELRGSMATGKFPRGLEASRPTNPSTPRFKKTSAGSHPHGAPVSSAKTPIPSEITTDMNASGSNSSGSRATQAASSSNLTLPHPGIAPSTLGKRHRDSTTSNVTGIFEEGQEGEFSEEELAKRVVRPMKKRPKIVQGEEPPEGREEELSSGPGSSPRLAPEEEEEEEEEEETQAPRVPSFTVFSGPDEPPEYIEPPPPTTHLPDFFPPPSPPAPGSSRQTTTTSTAHATENHHPFTFSFLPLSSTPAQSMYPLTMPSFPYPEPPQSPSPASHHAGFTGHHGESSGGRSDIFQSFGLPPPGRQRTGTASGSASREDGIGAFVDPAALTRRTSDRDPESTAVQISSTSGSGAGPAAGGGQADAPMKRTMYGTELDGDTRFGDFGVEGVATGFWAGGRF